MTSNSAIVAACKLAFTGFEKNDRSELLRLFATDFVFDVPDSLPYGGTFYGKEEFIALWQQLVAKEWEYFRYDCEVVLQDGDLPFRGKGFSWRTSTFFYSGREMRK